MKKLISFLFSSFIIYQLHAQLDLLNDQPRLIKECVIKLYTDNSDSLSRTETTRKNDSSFIVKTYRKDSSLIFTIHLKSINPEIKHGRYVSYFPNKKIHCNGQYADNIAYGDWRYYKVNGDLDTVINFNGAIKLLLSEEKKPIFQLTAVDASFEGGNMANFRLYVQKHFIFPDYALKRKIIGNVIVQFVVNDSGVIEMPKALRSVDNDLSMEIFRVLDSSPRWQPAKHEGIAVCKQFVLPIKFEIEK